ncbi:uncharacterized protein LOC142177092 [Nicotiana tabacum]|uniref:Uncharacterized protein LOC142177092 n=1 Tax=Nicotiana tabacum TaxID=4097 RepID=A0AC58TWP9_TOBAC
MGLNDSYSQARSQILMMKPVPSVTQAYAMLVSDESQRTIAAISGILGPLHNVHAGHYESTIFYSAKPTGGQKFRKNYNIQCEFCKLKGHSKENCYKIIGYPSDYKYKKKGGAPTTASNAYNVLSKTNNIVKNSTPQMYVTTGCTPEVPHMHTSEGNTRGNGISTALFATDNIQEWIIDTGATDHMVSDLSLLTSFNKVNPPYSKKVFLPNGDVSYVKHVGTSAISDKSVIKNVLHIPQFKFNLMSVSKDLFSGRVNAIGREDKGLYILLSWSSLTVNKHATETSLAATQNQDMFAKRTPTNFDKQVKCVRTDNGFEFVNSVCHALFKNLGIIHQRTCVYTPQQNGVAERKHRHILEVCRALRFQGCIPLKYWGHCMLAAVYLINRMPSSQLGYKSPYELLHRKKPLLGHLRVLGCLCYAKVVNETDKL